MRRISACIAVLTAVGCANDEPSLNDAGLAPTTTEPSALVASSSVAVTYRLSAPRARNHLLSVEASIPARGRPSITLMLPVWTPGSYLVREYARHLDQLEAHDERGRRLALEKVRKNRWRVQSDGVEQVRLRYRIYAREPTVRTNFLDEQHLVLAGAATFLTDLEALEQPHLIAGLPETFEDYAVDLPKVEGSGWLAANYDALVDAPIIGGKLRRLPFEVQGVPHELVQLGGEGLWPDARSAEDVRTLTRTLVEFWGEVPYSRYLFLNVIGLGRGGLEHRGSTLMMKGRLSARTEKGYRAWLSLVAHEHFHTWNGKRLRPLELGPFDYENEVYTEALWMVEGLTSYYDDLLLARAGLMTEEQYLEALTGQIERLESTPGRRVQPLSLASFDAWIEYYRPDQSSRNTTVSYYNKGAVVGFVLDMAIRRATAGRRSLDDVMRLAYARFSGARGYTSDELFGLFGEVGGPSVRVLCERLVQTTDEVRYEEALSWVGLRFEPRKEPDFDKLSAEELREKTRKTTWLGVESERREGRRVVTRVVAASPAARGGLQAGDELVALDDLRIGDDVDARVELYLPGERVEVLVARRGRMLKVPVELGKKPRVEFKVQVDPRAGARAERRRSGWLGPKS